MFFSFDGIDGAGKSTQMDLFVEWLTDLGHDVEVCRDPGTTELGEVVRDILLQAPYRIDNLAEMLLYMSSRAQLVQEFVRPAVQNGKVVVSDRYLLANVVYQGSAGGVNVDDIWNVGEIATGGLMPDLTIVLDLEPEEAAERLGKNRDRMESRGIGYFTEVRQGFITQAKRYADSHAIVDASQSIEQIQAQIRQAAQPFVDQVNEARS